MRQIFTQAKRHDTGQWVIVLGPETPMKEHRRFLKKNRIEGESSEYSAICLSFPGRTIKLRKKEAKAAAKAKAQEAPKVITPPVIPVPKKEPATAKRSTPTRLFGSRALKPAGAPTPAAVNA